MAMTLIQTISLSSTTASISFTSIPQTYKDLLFLASTRLTTASFISEVILVSCNSSTSNFSNRYLQGSGSAASSGNLGRFIDSAPAAGATSQTFSNSSIYVANYTAAQGKGFSTDAVSENNGTTGYQQIIANYWNDTAAITSITFTPNSGSFAANSVISMYGIS